MSTLERRIIFAITEAAAPPGARVTVRPAETRMMRHLESALDRLPAYKRLVVRGAIVVMWLWPLLAAPLRGPRKVLTSLSPEERLPYLVSWRSSRFFLRRALGVAILALVLSCYYADDRVAERLGWEAGPRKVEPLDPRGRAPHPHPSGH